MVWIFHRNDEITRVETRFENDTQRYAMRIVRQDGKDTTETFRDPLAFETRLQAIERELAEARWIQEGGPRLLKDGWRI
ncbi:MAG TPA: hypothetical protein VF147_17535 [Vicinamibacterales bacterium]